MICLRCQRRFLFVQIGDISNTGKREDIIKTFTAEKNFGGDFILIRFIKNFYGEFNIRDVFYGIEERGLVEVRNEQYENKHGDIFLQNLTYLEEYTHEYTTFERVLMMQFDYDILKGVRIFERTHEDLALLQDCINNVMSKIIFIVDLIEDKMGEID
ncbi:hypothetical protein RF11_09209 [Thelohanellus kitauei]|uniref:Uncharacterized protein n=1 Tax=Thelohanellus kitauei TaxID=669202 RepID=A0A0C2JPB3_THEKT|nr:hypothetical protein RF11_09209 [Thelohanellus kitauei]